MNSASSRSSIGPDRRFSVPEDLLVRLRQPGLILFLTGAGVSAESGIPTFRDALTGLWSRYRPEQLATPAAFEADPGLVWRWYGWRRARVSKAQPNPGHVALAELGRRLDQPLLVTQNVDGLHQRAGSENVIELHGNIFRDVCVRNRHPICPDTTGAEQPPVCPRCGSPARPDVVWFGETLPANAIETAQRAARCCRVFFSIGTSAMVYPAAELAHIARDSGAAIVEINPEPTPLTSFADFVLRGASGEVLPALNEGLEPRLSGEKIR